MVGGTKSRARVPILGPEASPILEGKYGKRLAAKHPDWGAEEIGANIYQVAMVIQRGLGDDTKGRKINSRGTTEAEYGSLTGIDGAEWQSMSANG